MSAFILDSEIVERIVKQYNVSRGGILDHDEQQTQFFILMNANIRSVNARYREKTPLWNKRKCALRKQTWPIDYDNIQVVKHLDCLEYQSNEIDSYYGSKAYKLLVEIRDYYASKIVRDSNAYDVALWG